MKIEKGHYVPKELITSEAIHEAVVKCFVAAGFNAVKERWHGFNEKVKGVGLAIDYDDVIAWLSSAETPLTLQQLFTAENGLQWPDWAEEIRANKDSVYFSSVVKFEFLSGSSYGGDSIVLATRQPKEKEVNEALDKAVIQFNGVWPDGGPWLVLSNNYLTTSIDAAGETISTKAEFTQRAKELGFINGYRWGVEYKACGDQPDRLPDDIKVSCEFKNHNIYEFTPMDADDVNWIDASLFKIIDQRYKPADTNYLNASSQDQSLTHKAELKSVSWVKCPVCGENGMRCETFDDVLSLITCVNHSCGSNKLKESGNSLTHSEEGLAQGEWYDYENQKALRLLDAGSEIEVFAENEEVRAIYVVWSGDNVVFGYDLNAPFVYAHFSALVYKFRPLDHATRKAELEKKRVVDAAVIALKNAGWTHMTDVSFKAIDALYSADLLRLPANKD
jgi:hypothetical protein